jgi:hypothetical protein
LKLKDEQLKMKDDQLNMKETQMNAYRSTIEIKNKEIEMLKADPMKIDKKLFDEKEALVKDLENKTKTFKEQIKAQEDEITLLKDDIDAADEEVEQLNQKIQKFEAEGKDSIFMNRAQVIAKMKQYLSESLHNVNICTPTIQDLVDLDLYEIKSSVNMKIACDIDVGNPKHNELLEEYRALENISLRIYDGKDRWSLVRDGELLFFVVIGKDPAKFLVFCTSDPAHIKLFNSLATESWTRGRKV